MDKLFEFVDINKWLSGRKILSDISFQMEAGKIYGLVGPNSAGKTTLAKILSGALPPDQGTIRLSGQELISDVACMIRNGVSCIHNDRVELFDMSVIDYLLLSRATRKSPTCIQTRRQIKERVLAVMNAYGLSFNLHSVMRDLSLSNQKLIELIMVLLQRPKVLILDELDVWFEGEEKELVLRIIRDTAGQGCAILFISHDLPAIRSICSWVSVIKDGRLISTRDVREVTPDGVIDDFFAHNKRHMLKVSGKTGEEIIRFFNVSGQYIKNVSFSIREGDVVGLSGNRGAGKTRLGKTMIGEEKYTGEIYFRNESIRITSPETAVNNGIAYITSELSGEALFPGFSVCRNMLPRYLQYGYSKREQADLVRKYIDMLEIRGSTPEQNINSLSLGAQKKIVIARWLLTKSDIFIFERPSANLDVGAILDIYSIINELRRMGKGVLLISENTKELSSVCNVVHVFRDGRIIKSFENCEATEEKLLFYLTGNILKDENKLRAAPR